MTTTSSTGFGCFRLKKFPSKPLPSRLCFRALLTLRTFAMQTGADAALEAGVTNSFYKDTFTAAGTVVNGNVCDTPTGKFHEPLVTSSGSSSAFERNWFKNPQLKKNLFIAVR